MSHPDDSPRSLFDAAAACLAEHAELSPAEARGTLRLVLRSAGLRPSLLTRAKLTIVLERILPRRLPGHDLASATHICTALVDDLARLPEGDGAATPESLFNRLNG